MDFLTTECAARSAGPANTLMTLLLQTLITKFCALSDRSHWPKDYGEEIVKKGKISINFITKVMRWLLAKRGVINCKKKLIKIYS